MNPTLYHTNTIYGRFYHGQDVPDYQCRNVYVDIKLIKEAIGDFGYNHPRIKLPAVNEERTTG